MKFIIASSALFLSTLAFAQYQNYDPNSPPNDYRSKDNPFYWKNRKPSESYWQQDVHYKIKASVDERTDIITGEETLTYWNNSPDTLAFVYFHIYQQAFVKGGHLENLNLNNNVKQNFGKYESKGLGETIESIKIGSEELRILQDFSVLKVWLPQPLLPNSSVTFDIIFKTYFDNGSQRRRMKKFKSSGYTHYDGVHWYPRMCVYDSKLGWDTDQHIGKEFYGEFGTYDVELTFASNYIVGATGTLQNESEVLPAELRSQLDIANFATKPWESPASVIIPYDSTKRKKWHFYAENVHDFAFTADPAYRIGEVPATIWDPYMNKTRKVLCQALVQEPHASRWQDAAMYSARVIEVLSRDFGMYSWPKIIAADARDGMEYPMLTLDGGQSPGYYDLLAHEIGHMWFFGQVGSNETYRAALDEGFSQFIESWAMRHITGDTVPRLQFANRYYDKHKDPALVLDQEVYLGYMPDAARGIDEPINQHSDGFHGALHHSGGYRHVYYKPAVMLWNLQYVLGDSLFQNSMKHYFNQWKFCHPYLEDFRNSIIRYSKVDLNWFFDQWMETTKTIDYSVKNVDRKDDERFEIEFSRRGRSQMPLDFEVEAKDGKKYMFHIPNTWFEKKTDAVILPKWYGWDKLHPSYTCTLKIPSGIEQVTIDPTYRLADVYMPDNTLKCTTRWRFDSQVYNPPDWRRYEINWRPDVWYNAVDGLKFGLHLDGDFFDVKNKFWLTAWFNSTVLQNQPFDYSFPEAEFDSIFPISFNFSYSSNTHRFIRNSAVSLSLKYLDGLAGGTASYTIHPNTKNSFSFGVKSMYRTSDFDLNYLLYPELWNAEQWNNTASITYHRLYNSFKGNGNINFELRSATLFSDYQYSDLTATWIHRHRFGKFDFGARLLGRIGAGAPAQESALYLAGASPEEMMGNKFVRSIGFVPPEWLGLGTNVNHFHHGGGLNLRGYSGYLSPELNEEDSLIYNIFSGRSGAAVNAELDFDNLIRLHPKLFRNWLHFDSYLFADAGTITNNNSENDLFFSGIRMDAGVGIVMTIKQWGPLEKVQPLTIRADFPIFINHAPAADANYFDFRWVIGIERAF